MRLRQEGTGRGSGGRQGLTWRRKGLYGEVGCDEE